MIRSGIIQAFSGTIFPTAISLLTNALLADRYLRKINSLQTGQKFYGVKSINKYYLVNTIEEVSNDLSRRVHFTIQCFLFRYEAAKIPAMQWKYRHNWYKFWAPKLKSFRSLWYFSLLANCLFGAYVGKQQFDIAGEMYSSVTDEDYLELWNSIVNTYRFEKKSKSP